MASYMCLIFMCSLVFVYAFLPAWRDKCEGASVFVSVFDTVFIYASVSVFVSVFEFVPVSGSVLVSLLVVVSRVIRIMALCCTGDRAPWLPLPHKCTYACKYASLVCYIGVIHVIRC